MYTHTNPLSTTLHCCNTHCICKPSHLLLSQQAKHKDFRPCILWSASCPPRSLCPSSAEKPLSAISHLPITAKDSEHTLGPCLSQGVHHLRQALRGVCCINNHGKVLRQFVGCWGGRLLFSLVASVKQLQLVVDYLTPVGVFPVKT